MKETGRNGQGSWKWSERLQQGDLWIGDERDDGRESGEKG